ncbi:MAG TPA: sulfite exporter TauE/SafE family protein [Pyrinomonadaceae bacterium]|nr:sulfite exporter TauE/SafE family protein [Pyrinomonadaceae bacterium]
MSSLDSPFVWLAIVCVFALAGFVKGIIGVGLPTVVMGLLGAVMPPAQAASLLVLPAIVTNIWQLAAGPSFLALVRRLWLMLAGICVGTWAGSGLLTSGNVEHTRFALGVILALYGCLGFTTIRFTVPRHAEPWLSPVMGVITGLLTGATGVPVIPALPYIQALGLEKEELIQALALSPLVSVLALGISLAGGGVLGLSVAGASLLAMVPALAGMYLGQWLRLRVSEAVFRRVFFAGLIALGGYLALRNSAWSFLLSG